MAKEVIRIGVFYICFLMFFPFQGFAFAAYDKGLLPADTAEVFMGPAEAEISSSENFYGTPHLLPATGQAEPIEKTESKAWLFWIIVLAFFLIALSRFYFRSRMQQFFRAAFANRHFSLMEKDGSFFNETVTYLLFLNFILVVSLLFFQTLNYTEAFSAIGEPKPQLVFGIIFLLLLLFYPLKALFTGFLAWVFKTSRTNAVYLKNIFLFNQLTGLAVLPIVAYNIYNPTATGIILGWALVVAANLVKVIRGTFMGYNEAGFSVYYLILYLCAVEIAPLLVIIKAGINYFSIPGSTGL